MQYFVIYIQGIWEFLPRKNQRIWLRVLGLQDISVGIKNLNLIFQIIQPSVKIYISPGAFEYAH